VINVEINNDQSYVRLHRDQVCKAVQMILQDAGISEAEISVAVVDDATICRLHRKYLKEYEPTDVMSFVYERGENSLEGEVIVSAETARMTAEWYGWTAKDELLLYMIHGTLHLVGYDDGTPEEKARMRREEETYLSRFGVEGRYEDSFPPLSDSGSGLAAEGE